MLSDPENTLPSFFITKLKSALDSLTTKAQSTFLPQQSPSNLVSIIFVESRLSSHIHSLIEKQSSNNSFLLSSSQLLQEAVFDARVSPLARAIDLKLPKLENYHPFRPTLSLSRPELQLFNNSSCNIDNNNNNINQLLADKMLRILVSWKDRKIRAEVMKDSGVPESFQGEVPRCLSRIRRQIAELDPILSHGNSNSNSGNTNTNINTDNFSQEKEVVVENLSQLVRSLEVHMRMKRYILRIIVGIVGFLIGSYLVRSFIGWRRSRSLLKERIAAAEQMNSQQEGENDNDDDDNACSICLRKDSSSSSSSGEEDNNSVTNTNNTTTQRNSNHRKSVWISLRCNHRFHLKCLFEWIDQGFNNNRQILVNNFLQAQQQQQQVLQQQANNNNNNNFSCSCPLCRRRDDDITLALESCGQDIYNELRNERRNQKKRNNSNTQNSRSQQENNHQIINDGFINQMLHSLLFLKNETRSFTRYLWTNIKSVFVFVGGNNNVEFRIYFLHMVYMLLPLFLRLAVQFFEYEGNILKSVFFGSSSLISSNRSPRQMELDRITNIRAFETSF